MLGISAPHAGHICTLCWAYLHPILGISAPYARHICTLCWAYLHPMLGISAPYAGHRYMVSRRVRIVVLGIPMGGQGIGSINGYFAKSMPCPGLRCCISRCGDYPQLSQYSINPRFVKGEF